MKECPCLRRICQCFATLLVVSHFVQSIKMLRCLNIMVLLQWWHDWMYLLMLLRWFRKGGYLVYNLYCMGCFERYGQEPVIGSNALIMEGCIEVCSMDIAGCKSWEHLENSLDLIAMIKYDELHHTTLFYSSKKRDWRVCEMTTIAFSQHRHLQRVTWFFFRNQILSQMWRLIHDFYKCAVH